jgi:predicted Rossmann fold nucleotide-binding protein DprA/Smf involved in DNA uptake
MTGRNRSPTLKHWPEAVPRSAECMVLGDASLLDHDLIGILCSRRAPGPVVIATHDWARAARDASIPVIGGFQSPMERDALRFLLRGEQPVIICPARGISSYRMPAEWRKPIDSGRLAVVSPFADRHRRMTAQLAAERNRFVAAVAAGLLIAHASPGGVLETLHSEIIHWGKPIFTFDHPANSSLISAGAEVWHEGHPWQKQKQPSKSS